LSYGNDTLTPSKGALSPILVGERVLITLWVGALWAIGYIAAPVLFSLLQDRSLAGSLAGQMFHIVSYIGIACGGILLAAMLPRHGLRWRTWILITMLVLVICGEFVLQPMMQELKSHGLIEGSTEKARFGMLHGIASVVYLGNCVLGLVLVIFRPSDTVNAITRD
jgi:MFS family permease